MCRLHLSLRSGVVCLLIRGGRHGKMISRASADPDGLAWQSGRVGSLVACSLTVLVVRPEEDVVLDVV